MNFTKRLCRVYNSYANSARRSKKKKLVATVAVTSLIYGTLAPLTGCKGQKFDIGPSTGEVVGVAVGAVAVVGVTTAVLIHENHVHHSLKGCVSSGPNGFEIQTEDNKSWLLTGNTSMLPVSKLLKLHGNKRKQPKHSSGEGTFDVESVRKDYGPCKAVPATTASFPDQEPPARAE